MLKNSFLGRRDEPSAKDSLNRPSVDTPLYPPKSDAPPLAAVAVTTHRDAASASTSAMGALLRPAAETSGNVATGGVTSSTTSALGPRLTVGPNIKLKGAEINDCDTLVVEGHVEASMDSKTLEILQSGSYEGTVSIDVAEIHGRFSGSLTARKKLIVHGTGFVTGTVRYGSLLVSEGGIVSGDVASLDAKAEAQANLFAGYPSSRATPNGAVKANGTEHVRP
jgi:cytoskeletal protein CcmA (bactofilin family)